VRRNSTVYLVLDDDGAGVVGLDVVLDGVLAGIDEGEAAGVAGVAGAVDVVWLDVLGAASFFSPVVGADASLSEEGFILSE
jgi:hypothetical protein